jgi:iron complex outermembrane receptor protein
VTSDGSDANDDWRSLQGGRGLIGSRARRNKFTFQGNYYNDFVNENQNVVVLNAPYVTTTNQQNHDYGGNALFRWTHQISQFSTLTLQTYYDHFKQEQVGTSETRDTFDFDAQHRFPLGSRHDIIWGFGYHFTADEFPNTFPENFFSVLAPARTAGPGVQRVCAGRNHPRAAAVQRHAGVQVRAQRLHRL